MTIASKIVRRVATIDENKSVLDAAKLMTEEFIGSVVVTNSSGIRGLFTEHELVMNVVGKGKAPEKVQIKEVGTDFGAVTLRYQDFADLVHPIMAEFHQALSNIAS